MIVEKKNMIIINSCAYCAFHKSLGPYNAKHFLALMSYTLVINYTSRVTADLLLYDTFYV